MESLLHLIKTPIVLAFFYLTFSHTLDNCLDPGASSTILPVVIGVAVGGLFAITLFWNSVKTFFKNLFSRGENTKEIRNRGNIFYYTQPIFEQEFERYVTMQSYAGIKDSERILYLMHRSQN